MSHLMLGRGQNSHPHFERKVQVPSPTQQHKHPDPLTGLALALFYYCLRAHFSHREAG